MGCVQRWSKNEYKMVHNGCYDDEETAAHASDTLARKLMENGELNHKLNFPDTTLNCTPKIKRKREIDQKNEAQKILKQSRLLDFNSGQQIQNFFISPETLLEIIFS